MKLLKGNDLLNANQCNALRGIAIIGIFLHNFCHWLKPGIILENEYNFNFNFSRQMWDYLTQGGIDMYLPIQFFSFFGHYGVPIFLFLSGFGLVMKYENENNEKSGAIQLFCGVERVVKYSVHPPSGSAGKESACNAGDT